MTTVRPDALDSLEAVESHELDERVTLTILQVTHWYTHIDKMYSKLTGSSWKQFA